MVSCRMVGYVGTDRERLACALHQLRTTLVAGQGQGYGVAHYTDDAVLLNRRPSVTTQAQPFASFVGGLHSRVVLAHTFPEEPPKVPARDLQPFKLRQWAMAMTGGLPPGEGQQEEVRLRLLDGIPDFLRRDVQGYTCAEALFHRFLWRLHEADQLDGSRDPSGALAALRSTLEEAHAMAGELGIQEVCGPNVITTDGHRMFVLRQGEPVAYSQRDSIPDCELCYAGGRDEDVSFGVRESHQRFRGIFVASDVHDFPESWQRLEKGSALIIDSSMELVVM
ncbi:MAG: hypothetical protein ABIJ09_04130 [Pseudomonadota bacterium]